MAAGVKEVQRKLDMSLEDLCQEGKKRGGARKEADKAKRSKDRSRSPHKAKQEAAGGGAAPPPQQQSSARPPSAPPAPAPGYMPWPAWGHPMPPPGYRGPPPMMGAPVYGRPPFDPRAPPPYGGPHPYGGPPPMYYYGYPPPPGPHHPVPAPKPGAPVAHGPPGPVPATRGPAAAHGAPGGPAPHHPPPSHHALPAHVGDARRPDGLRGAPPVHPANGPVGFQVRLNNVPPELTARDLAEAFGEVSTNRVESADLSRNARGQANGEAIVVFNTAADAQNAVRRYHGGDLNGRRLQVIFEGEVRR